MIRNTPNNVISIVDYLIGSTKNPIIIDTHEELESDEDDGVEWDDVIVTGDFVFNPSRVSRYALTMVEVQDKMDDMKSIMATLGCDISFDEIQSFIYDDDNEFG